MRTLVVACGLAMSAITPAMAQPASGAPRGALRAPVEDAAQQLAEQGVRGRIESVTVYRGQALVTRLVDGDANGKAVQEVVVTNLPHRIAPESLHAEGLGGAAVRSVRFRTRPVVQDTREDVRGIDAQLEEFALKAEGIKKQQELIAEHRAYLLSLQQFVAPTATTELSRGVLNAQTLEQMSTNLRQQRKQLAEEELRLTSEGRNIERAMSQLRRQREEITQSSSTAVYEAVVLVARSEKDGAGGGSAAFRLRYLVNDATWEPSYTLRASKDGVALEYYASIAQMSGEDWGDVKMTLSTATPSLVAGAPALAPISLSLALPTPQQAAMAYADAVRSLERQREDVLNLRMQARNIAVAAESAQQGKEAGGQDFDQKLNDFARDRLVLDLTSGKREEAKSKADRRTAAMATEGVAVTYTVQGATTLPSRSDRQLVQIASVPVQASFVKVATPALTNYVYDQLASTNSSGMVLLAGPLASYSEGAFVGSGSLGTTASGQSFEAGLGIDSALRTRRELVDRAESVQGGNRVVTITYRLVVENFGAAAAMVRVQDRLPIVQRGVDIKVRLQSTSVPLASEQRVAGAQPALQPASQPTQPGSKLADTGQLAWDVEVPAGASGDKELAIEYTYTMEYDKQMTLVGG